MNPPKEIEDKYPKTDTLYDWKEANLRAPWEWNVI